MSGSDLVRTPSNSHREIESILTVGSALVVSSVEHHLIPTGVKELEQGGLVAGTRGPNTI